MLSQLTQNVSYQFCVINHLGMTITKRSLSSSKKRIIVAFGFILVLDGRSGISLWKFQRLDFVPLVLYV